MSKQGFVATKATFPTSHLYITLFYCHFQEKFAYYATSLQKYCSHYIHLIYRMSTLTLFFITYSFILTVLYYLIDFLFHFFMRTCSFPNFIFIYVNREQFTPLPQFFLSNISAPAPSCSISHTKSPALQL